MKNDYFKTFFIILFTLLILIQLINLFHESTLFRQTTRLNINLTLCYYKNQTELNFIFLNYILIHLKTMAVLASASENLHKKSEQHRIVKWQLQFNMTKMSRTVLILINRKCSNIKGSIASRTLYMIITWSQSRIVQSTTNQTTQ